MWSSWLDQTWHKNPKKKLRLRNNRRTFPGVGMFWVLQKQLESSIEIATSQQITLPRIDLKMWNTNFSKGNNYLKAQRIIYCTVVVGHTYYYPMKLMRRFLTTKISSSNQIQKLWMWVCKKKNSLVHWFDRHCPSPIIFEDLEQSSKQLLCYYLQMARV